MNDRRKLFIISGLVLAYILIPVFSETVSAAVERPHSFAIKFGYHTYPSSDFFSAYQAAGLGDAATYSGAGIELLSYDYRISPDWSVDIDFLSG